MHDDFYKMTGCMHAVSTYFRTRRRDGTRFTTTGPTRVVQAFADRLDKITEELLQIAFEMEAAENIFQKAWEAEQTGVFAALVSVHRAAGSASRMPADPLSLQRMRILWGRVLANPGDGTDGKAFTDALRLGIQDTESVFTGAGRPAVIVASYNTSITKLKDILTRLRAALDDYYAAFSVMRNGLMGQADAFVLLYPKLELQVTPWSGMDERLRELMKFMERSAKAGIGGGPGDTSTPSWGSVATSGSSSIGSYVPPPPSSGS